MVAQVILVVQQKFFQTAPCHIGQQYFRFGGSGRSTAALSDILAPAARRLHHLVPVARTQVAMPAAKGDRRVKDNLCHLKRPQRPKPTART